MNVEDTKKNSTEAKTYKISYSSCSLDESWKRQCAKWTTKYHLSNYGRMMNEEDEKLQTNKRAKIFLKLEGALLAGMYPVNDRFDSPSKIRYRKKRKMCFSLSMTSPWMDEWCRYRDLDNRILSYIVSNPKRITKNFTAVIEVVGKDNEKQK